MAHSENKTKYKKSSKFRLDEISRSDEATAHVNTPRRSPLSKPNCIPCSKVVDNSTVGVEHGHHYHYIRTHSAYYDKQSNQQRCKCPCSCSQYKEPDQHLHLSQRNNSDAKSNENHNMDVPVTVHKHNQRQQNSLTRSEQSVHSHSYQVLHIDSTMEGINEPTTGTCKCDLDCRCGNQIHEGLDFALLRPAATSEGNDTILRNNSRNMSGSTHRYSNHNKRSIHNEHNSPSSQIDLYSDGDGDGTNSCIKITTDETTSDDDQRPPLPPRPPPRNRNVFANMNSHHSNGLKKYVVWCFICGGFSCLLGILFLGVYFLLHSYTITVGNFETVPTFVPATLLILTGLCIISLARRKNRYSYLIKLSGVCGLISALTCALVTVTTTVLHMSRLQALRECEYAQKTRTCTCYSDMVESQVDRMDKEGVRLVFDSLSDCGVVHGSLYSCLRAIFGLSVAGVLIAVFSCMLVYQLLSHERKKMYWEQLELRCRSLYTTQQGPSMHGPNMSTLNGCEQCYAHRQTALQSFPWDDGSENRFWTGQPPGNFYSPNPGPDINSVSAGCRGIGINHVNSRGRATGWSWPRMPWQRNLSDSNTRYRETPSSPDSQYGFSNNASANETALSTEHGGMLQLNSQALGLPYGVWGPPPPYSDPNSPARRGFYHSADRQIILTGNTEGHTHRTLMDNQPVDGPTASRNVIKRQSCGGGGGGGGTNANICKAKADHENTPSDSDGGCTKDRFSNTLPTRKAKKRVEGGAKSIGANSHSAQRVNVQNVFTSAATDQYEYTETNQLTNTTNSAGVDNFAANDEAEVCDLTESEVYFADVSNVSVKNDNYYEDTNHKSTCFCDSQHHSKHKTNEDYLAQRFGHRENSVRSRLPFPQICSEAYDAKKHMNIALANSTTVAVHNHMQKDISRQSMCSIDSGEKTDFTDLSPTQGTSYGNVPCTTPIQKTGLDFVALLPFSSESQSLEAHRRSTKSINDSNFLTPETQYEVINESSNSNFIGVTSKDFSG